MAFELLNDQAREAVSAARIAAIEVDGIITSTHLLIGVLSVSCSASETLQEFSLSPERLKAALKIVNAKTLKQPKHTEVEPGLVLTVNARVALNAAAHLASQSSVAVDPELLTIGALVTQDPQLNNVLEELRIVKTDLVRTLSSQQRAKLHPEEPLSLPRSSQALKRPAPSPTTRHALEKFTVNLTDKAKNNELDPIVGRDMEIQRCLEILGRRTKANPVLVGDAGVGKTAVVEGLATLFANNLVPTPLAHSEIYALDIAALFAGTRLRGDIETRVQQLLKEAAADPHVILFIDEVHSVVGAGAGFEAATLSDLLKPVLARGTVRLIGATTRSEYTKYIEKDAALERRFTAVDVAEPTPDQAVAMLQILAPELEKHHRVRYTPSALRAAVDLAVRYVPDRRLPDKAIDLLDETGAAFQVAQRHRDEGSEEIAEESSKSPAVNALAADGESPDPRIITDHDIAATLTRQTAIPVLLGDDEVALLRSAEHVIGDAVIGQPRVVAALARTLRRRRAGIHLAQRPASFLSVGPSGVGKTHLAKVVSKLFFSSDDIIRIDMSEYMEPHSVARLLGAPPGYVGHDEPGQLTEALRRRPYAVVLFDEIDKAHPQVLDILLQMLEDGHITDSHGRKVRCDHAIIFLTANPPATTRSQNPTGFGAATPDPAQRHAAVLKEVKKAYRPEFLNRLDEVLVFEPLSLADRIRIARTLLEPLEMTLLDSQCWLEVDDEALAHLANYAYDPDYGARPIRRAVQELVLDPLAELRLSGQLRHHQIVRVTLSANCQLQFSLSSAPTAEPALPRGAAPENGIGTDTSFPTNSH